MVYANKSSMQSSIKQIQDCADGTKDVSLLYLLAAVVKDGSKGTDVDNRYA